MVNAKSRSFCTYCNRSGHDYSGCFLVHGMPDWWLHGWSSMGIQDALLLCLWLLFALHCLPHLPLSMPPPFCPPCCCLLCFCRVSGCCSFLLPHSRAHSIFSPSREQPTPSQPALSTPSMPTRLNPDFRKSNPKYAFSIVTTACEPANITQALKDPHWRAAMIDEFKS